MNGQVILFLIFRSWLADLHPVSFFFILTAAMVFFFWLFSISKNLLLKILNLYTEGKDLTEIFLDRIGPSHNMIGLAKNAVEVLMENINCKNAVFLLFNPEKDLFEAVYAADAKKYSISAIDPFFRHITPATEIYDRELIYFDPRSASPPSGHQTTHRSRIADSHFPDGLNHARGNAGAHG